MVSNNDDDSRHRRDDNPFISFRRFADGQLSALFGTVFDLPSLLLGSPEKNISNNYAKCLHSGEDPAICAKLQELEKRFVEHAPTMAELADLNDAAAFGEALDELRKIHAEYTQIKQDRARRYGPSWFGGSETPQRRDNGSDEDGCRRRRWGRRNNEDHPDFRSRWEARNKRWDAEESSDERKFNGDEFKPNVRSWSWSFPRPADEAGHRQRPVEDEIFDKADRDFFRSMFRKDQFNAMFEEMEQMFGKDVAQLLMSQQPDWSYLPRELEKDESLKKTGVSWRAAFEDLLRAEQGKPLLSEEELRKLREYPKRVPWTDDTPDEPSYEYGHDHEDQHDEPPSPRKEHHSPDSNPSTELDAYERFLNPKTTTSQEPSSSYHPSILSTLTTTERTVAPNGTITTRVVLKKRFADGKEETSETVHTQQGSSNPDADFWSSNPKTPESADSMKKSESEKKRGWFWSG